MKISALLREAPSTPALSLDQDLMQRAMLKFPGYDSQQALSLYMADKLAQQQKIDASQNNLINTQRNAIQTLGKELNDYEQQAQETDREVERLKQLSGMLTTGSSNTQQKAKVSADELEKLQKDLEALKSKPGMDPEKYKEIEQQINALANSSGAEDDDVKGLQNLVNNIQNKAKVNFDDVEAQLKQTKKDLDNKEIRFKKYVKDTGEYKATTTKELQQMANMSKTSAEEIKKYSDIVTNAKKKLDGFDEFMNNEKNNILSIRGEIQDMANDLASKTDEVNDLVDIARVALKNPNAAAVAQNAIGQAQQSSQAAGQPGQSTRTKPLPSFIDDKEENKQTTNEEAKMPVRPAFNYADDPDLGSWMQKTLPYLVDQFKKKYNLELKRKNPSYTDHQIAYTIEDNIDVLLKQDTDTVSRDEVLNKFLTWVKHELFRLPPESTIRMKQVDDLFAESLDRTYARMLDNLIGLPYIKG